MRLRTGALATLLLCQMGPALAVEVRGHDQELRALAVNIFRSPRQSWPGYGIYLGARRVITAIADVASTGNSGSGVFNSVKGCLMGIMSRKIQVNKTTVKNGRRDAQLVDLAKYFVPAAQIRAFLAVK